MRSPSAAISTRLASAKDSLVGEARGAEEHALHEAQHVEGGDDDAGGADHGDHRVRAEGAEENGELRGEAAQARAGPGR